MSKQIAVIGLGRFGESLCIELSLQGAEVLAVDIDEDAVKKVSNIVSQAVIADTSDALVVDELNLQDYDCVFVSIGQDLNASILITLVLKEAGVTNLWVKSKDKLHDKILRKIGADHVLNPEYQMAKRLAGKLLSDSLFDFVNLNDDLSIYGFVIPEKFHNHTIAALELSKDISLLGLNRDAAIYNQLSNDKILLQGDVLIVAGEKAALQRLLHQL